MPSFSILIIRSTCSFFRSLILYSICKKLIHGSLPELGGWGDERFTNHLGLLWHYLIREQGTVGGVTQFQDLDMS